MKVLGVCLLAFVVAVQARSTAVKTTAASTSANPWVVHLRIAVSTSGHLRTCVGSLIDNRWVLTAASCMENVRFVWIRYGADNVISPELVTETTAVHTHGEIALISINRAVEYTDNIDAVTLATYDDIITETGTVCVYGVDEDNSPGEQLVCSEWILEPLEVGTTVGISEGVPPTRYDIGAPLVSNGVQIGVLTSLVEGPTAVFKNPAIYRDWIKEQTGVEL